MIVQKIKLTQSQAESVVGEYNDLTLKPIQDGEYWYLPHNILSCDSYSEAFTILNTCEIVYVEITEDNNNGNII